MYAPDSFLSDFEALSKLLSSSDAQERPAASGSVDCGSGGSGATPSSVGPAGLLPVKVAAPRGARVEAAAKAAGGAGKSAAAHSADDEADAALDQDNGREVPSHEFLYKQAVATTDAFLGMSGKDPSSACCEELVVRIKLPEAASAAALDLDVRDTRLRLTSARYKLLLHLPRKVDAAKGRARWDASKKELSVTAPIVPDDGLL